MNAENQEIKRMTKEEAYNKFPFITKLSKVDIVQLMGALLVLTLLGPTDENTILYALRSALSE